MPFHTYFEPPFSFLVFIFVSACYTFIYPSIRLSFDTPVKFLEYSVAFHRRGGWTSSTPLIHSLAHLLPTPLSETGGWWWRWRLPLLFIHKCSASLLTCLMLAVALLLVCCFFFVFAFVGTQAGTCALYCLCFCLPKSFFQFFPPPRIFGVVTTIFIF